MAAAVADAKKTLKRPPPKKKPLKRSILSDLANTRSRVGLASGGLGQDNSVKKPAESSSSSSNGGAGLAVWTEEQEMR